ncbi:hypothetical protein, partial [Nostoc sp. 2RC]|uniref:hypothetical protein n=1 Tax=Nostoc sp. 2RC TaxID=2485484 RepID=UPI001C8A6DD2
VLVAVLVIVHKYYDLAIACASCVSPEGKGFKLFPPSFLTFTPPSERRRTNRFFFLNPTYSRLCWVLRSLNPTYFSTQFNYFQNSGIPHLCIDSEK